MSTTRKPRSQAISIHALREEGDVRKSGRPDRHRRVISIHALREEGDTLTWKTPLRLP